MSCFAIHRFPSRSARIAPIVALLTAGASVAGVASPSAASPKPTKTGHGFAITYKVTGSDGVRTAEIQYLAAGGNKVVLPSVGLPWSYSFRTPTGRTSGPGIPADPVGVYVESAGASEGVLDDNDAGLLTCEIWANGSLIEQESADENHVATCFARDFNDQVEE